MGFLSPLVVEMKILFQELCINKTNWDAELNRELLEQWKSILQDMSLMYSCMVLATHQNVPTLWLFMLEATTMMVNLRFDWFLLKRELHQSRDRQFLV